MKSCPTCNRTYPDDTIAFCLMDGSVLSAPFDPEKAREIKIPREPSPPRTEVMTTETLPPTQAAREPDLSTITSSSPIQPQSPIQPAAASGGSERSSAWIWIVLVLVVVAVVILLLKFA